MLLTDHNMPGRSGVDLIHDVRTRWPALQCILASGYMEEEEIKRTESELGAPILNKPYNVHEATSLVGRLIAAATPP